MDLSWGQVELSEYRSDAADGGGNDTGSWILDQLTLMEGFVREAEKELQ